MTTIGTRICQRPECGKEFDIGFGGGRAKYCPGCRDIVMTERHRERARRIKNRNGGDGKNPPNRKRVG